MLQRFTESILVTGSYCLTGTLKYVTVQTGSVRAHSKNASINAKCYLLLSFSVSLLNNAVRIAIVSHSTIEVLDNNHDLHM